MIALLLGVLAWQFHAETRLVVVDVAVRQASGEVVTGLDASAFTVYENGRPQPIALFLGENAPVSVGLVVDNSGSMRDARVRVEAAALAFARASDARDEIFVVNFADRARVDVPMTTDVAALEAGIQRGDAIGGTALRDAIDLGERYLNEHARHRRKVLLVISDGYDNASDVSPAAIARTAGRHGIVIYAVGLPAGSPARASEARRALDHLAESTGGVVRYVATLDEASAAAVDLARQIRQQYTLAYTPRNTALDGTYRRITVKVAANTPGRVSIRTRDGYVASPAPERTR
jgi:Ca-activated chloride channel family protein